MNPLRLILVPTLIGAICTAILAFVNLKTKPVIAETERKNAAAAAQDVLPASLPAPVLTNLHNTACFASFDAAGKLQALAIEGVSQKGYGGEIRLMVGFTTDATLHTFKVLAANGETPGLGSKVKSDDFRLPLSNRKTAANWFLKKDGGELDAITSATISSRAALDALRDAIAKYNIITGDE